MPNIADDSVETSGILDRLHLDHEEIKDLLEKLCEDNDAGKLAPIFEALRAALLANTGAEEACFYSRLLKEDDDARFFALKAQVEDDLIKILLERLGAGGTKGSDEWLAQCIVLKELFERHVEEEEGEGFEIAREIFDDETLARLGGEFERERQRLLKA